MFRMPGNTVCNSGIQGDPGPQNHAGRVYRAHPGPCFPRLLRSMLP